MTKTELKKQFQLLYGDKHGKIDFVDVPDISFFIVDDRDDPNGLESLRTAEPAQTSGPGWEAA